MRRAHTPRPPHTLSISGDSECCTACYIEVDENENETVDRSDENDSNNDDPDHCWTQWSNLPDHILERIFSHLTIKERYYASLV